MTRDTQSRACAWERRRCSLWPLTATSCSWHGKSAARSTGLPVRSTVLPCVCTTGLGSLVLVVLIFSPLLLLLVLVLLPLLLPLLFAATLTPCVASVAGRLAGRNVGRRGKAREILQAWLHGTRRYRLAACSDPPSDGTSRQPRDESHAIVRGRTLSRDHLAVAAILTLLGYYDGPPNLLGVITTEAGVLPTRQVQHVPSKYCLRVRGGECVGMSLSYSSQRHHHSADQPLFAPRSYSLVS